MKKHLFPLALLAAGILAATAAPKAKNADPVVMTVNGKDITRSEFKYLYEKNNLQQMTPQSIEEYVDMFVVYKLKVAEAEACGVDTTATFKKEFDGYCADLSRPYMTDSLVESRLYHEAYERSKTIREVSHIMLPMARTRAEREANRQRLDSIRTAILNGADFGKMAVKYSADRSALNNNGSMGYITAGSYPYPFEKAAWDTPVGTVSEVFEDFPYGIHIIKVTGEQTNPGTISARHILKLTQGLSPEEAQVKKAQIDSIHTLLKNGADFEALAMVESEDRGSAAKGGNLGDFGRGMMVPEFEKTAFALAPGEISEPFSTSYGYHIVQTIKHNGIPTFEQQLPQLMMTIKRDSRGKMAEQAKTEQFKQQYGVKMHQEAFDAVELAAKAETDPAKCFETLRANNVTLASLPASKVTVSDVINGIPDNVRDASVDVPLTFAEAADRVVNEAVRSYAREQLALENTTYRNLVNEYRDGILLFEVSNRNVWDRSGNDKEGLEAFFTANRGKYTWDAPRFKGLVILATSDSIASEARTYLANNTVEKDSLVKNLRENFGNEIKIERVLSAKGDNAIIDEIAFNGPKADPVGKWVAWFPYQTRIIETPEEASDVRGQVTADYQQQLETEWVNTLRAKYPVKLNKKELQKL